MNISENQRKLSLLGSLFPLCLIGNTPQAWASTPPSFPTYPPLTLSSPQNTASSSKLLFKLKKAAMMGASRKPGVQVLGNTRSINDTQAQALGIKFKAKVLPLLEDNPKREKLNPRLSQVYVAEFPAGSDLAEALKGFKAEPNVEYVEINGVMQATKTPNDPYFTYQWSLHNTGQSGGTPDADIDAPEGWEISTGIPSTVVAVVDTGVDWNHIDLSGKVILGWDFAYGDPYPDDVYGHGTHVAGIAAAKSHENIGIAGICWDCQVLAVKVLDDGGSGYWEWIAEGISYATWNGAKVINLSLGGWYDSQVVHDAIKDAYNAGVTVVAAAGNGWGPPVSYPAAYEEVIAVSATDYFDQLTYFSSYGPELDVAAPGLDILSSLPGDSYAWWSGTSMATPHVAGAVGTLLSLNPKLSPAEVRQCVMNSADDLGSPGWDEQFGSGRLNLQVLLSSCGKKSCMGEICTIEGEGNIYGTLGDDVICGSNKNDTILAKSGNDLICAGEGNDIVIADAGHDKVDGGPGDDILKGGSGRDVLMGKFGKDMILGGTEDDVLIGNLDDDYLHGGNGNDVLLGHDGNDQLCGSSGNDYFNAGVGNDKCDLGSSGVDKGKGCEISVPCPIVNALQIDSPFLTPALKDALQILKGLGVEALDVNR